MQVRKRRRRAARPDTPGFVNYWLIVLAGLWSLTAAPQGNDEYSSTGIIVGLDREAQRLTLAHDEVPELPMRAMVMSFRISDTRLLDGLNVGSAVRFTFREGERPDQLVVTDVEPLAEGQGQH